MAFEVKTTPEAEYDAAAVLDWLIEKHAGETGLRWFMKMDEAIASLAELPNRCKLAPEISLSHSRFESCSTVTSRTSTEFCNY